MIAIQGADPGFAGDVDAVRVTSHDHQTNPDHTKGTILLSCCVFKLTTDPTIVITPRCPRFFSL